MWCQTIKLNAYHFVAPVNNAREKRQRGYNPLTPQIILLYVMTQPITAILLGVLTFHLTHNTDFLVHFHPILLFFSRERSHVTQTQDAWHTVNITKQ